MHIGMAGPNDQRYEAALCELEADLARVTAERDEALALLRECITPIWIADGEIESSKYAELAGRTEALLAKVQPSQPGG